MLHSDQCPHYLQLIQQIFDTSTGNNINFFKFYDQYNKEISCPYILGKYGSQMNFFVKFRLNRLCYEDGRLCISHGVYVVITGKNIYILYFPLNPFHQLSVMVMC